MLLASIKKITVEDVTTAATATKIKNIHKNVKPTQPIIPTASQFSITALTPQDSKGDSFGNFREMTVFQDKLYVMERTGNIYHSSSDGITWKSHTEAPKTIDGITYELQELF